MQVAPIFVPDQTWDLAAAPEELEAIADVLRAIAKAAHATLETVDRAAAQVVADRDWLGDTAEAYHQHRNALSRDMANFADTSLPPARALDEIAEVLRFGQRSLANERDNLAAIPHRRSGDGTTYHPRSESEAAAVRAAVTAAGEMRDWVGQGLAGRIADFQRAQAEFETIGDAWRPRAVTHLNLNAGMGRGGGTSRGNLDELAQAIGGSGADVVTLQEVKHDNTPLLLAKLEQITGAEWTVAATSEPTMTDDGPYGNAVLVRQGGSVEVPADSRQPPVVLADPDDVSGRGTPENREAAVAEVRIVD